MSIIRAPRPRAQYTTISNALIRDGSLSLRARGLLIQLLSHTDGWRTDSVSLSKVNPEGRDAIRTALKELEKARYLVRIKWNDSKGHWNTDSFVFDEPVPEGYDPSELLANAPDPDDLSTGDGVDDPADEHLFEDTASSQVTPGTDSQASGGPTPGYPTPGSQALSRRTIEEPKVVKVGEHLTGGRGSTTPPPKNPSAAPPGLAALDRDEHGTLHPTCPTHRHAPTTAPCAACGAYRESYATAERLRAAQWRREAADRAIQADRADIARKAPPEVAAAALSRARAALREATTPPPADQDQAEAK